MLKKLKNYIPILLMLLFIIAAAILIWTGRLDVEKIIRDARDNIWTASAVVIGIYLLKGFTAVLPQLGICMASAAVLGPYSAVIVNTIGTVLCITESYLIGKFSKKLTFEGMMEKNPKFKKYFTNAQNYNLTFVFSLHSLHLSTEVQGVLFGLLRTPYWDYLAGSMLALFPSLVYFTVLDLKSPVFWIFVGLDAVVVVLGVFYAKRKIIDGGKKS